MKKKLLIIFIIIVFLVLVANIFGKGWIIYHEGSFKGKVIDAETKDPIEGAVVVAVYNISDYGFVESYTHSEDAKEVLTNKNGEFYISPNIFFSLYPNAHGDATEFIIYKPGYTAYPSYEYFSEYFPNSPLRVDIYQEEKLFKKGVTVELLKLKTNEERKRNLTISTRGFTSWHLPLLYKLINEEQRYFGLGERKS